MKNFKDMEIAQKITVVMGIAIACFAVVYILLLKPVLVELAAMPDKQLEQKQKYNMAMLEIEHLKSVKKESAKTLVELTQIDQMMPESKGLPGIIVDIQEIADNSGVSFVSITPKDMLPHNKFIELPLEVKINSQFYEFVDFLYQLEKMPRRVKVSMIHIEEGEPHLPQIVTTVNCSAFIYDETMVDPNKAPAAPPPAEQPGQNNAE